MRPWIIYALKDLQEESRSTCTGWTSVTTQVPRQPLRCSTSECNAHPEQNPVAITNTFAVSQPRYQFIRCYYDLQEIICFPNKSLWKKKKKLLKEQCRRVGGGLDLVYGKLLKHSRAGPQLPSDIIISARTECTSFASFLPFLWPAITASCLPF